MHSIKSYRVGVFHKNIDNYKNFINKVTDFKHKNFYKHELFDKYVRFQYKIHKHPFGYVINKIENEMITFDIISLTSSKKDIKLNGEIVTVSPIGTYLKEGKEVIQYASNASCTITMSIKDFNFMVKDIHEDDNELKKIGLNTQKSKEIQNKLENWCVNNNYRYDEYLKRSIELYYSKYEKFIKEEEELKQKNFDEE